MSRERPHATSPDLARSGMLGTRISRANQPSTAAIKSQRPIERARFAATAPVPPKSTCGEVSGHAQPPNTAGCR